MLASPLLASNFGAAVSQVAARVRASVAEVHSRGGSGSGTIWTGDGIVVTNDHVVRTDEARVSFDRAIALANTPAEAAHIRMCLDRLIKDNVLNESGFKSGS